MCGGGKSSTTKSSTTALPQYADAYSNILGQAQNVAQTPYNPATNETVAGFTAPQNQAFQNVQSNQGVYSPYLNSAGASASQGVLTPDSIQQFMNPWTQNVVDATQAQFNSQNAQQLQDVNANAAKVGALTGDRSQVARSITQNQQNLTQNPIIAGLYSQGYQNAGQLAGQSAQLANQNAALYGQLGGQAQQYASNDVNSLFGAGQAQQTQQQNVNNAATANAQQQTAWPYQNLQWLSSLATSLGGAAGTNSTQTTPGPNLGSQLLGGALGIGSLFLNRGGRVGYADGGGVAQTSAPFGTVPWMPQAGMSGAAGMHTPSLGSQTGSDSGMGGLLSSFNQAKSAFQGAQNAGQGMSNIGSWLRTNTGAPSTTGAGDAINGFATTVNPSGMSGWGNYLSSLFSRGGQVRRGYDDGGAVDPWTPTVTPEAPSISLPTLAPTLPGVVPKAPDNKGLLGLNLAPETRQSLLAAGLGMMAAKTPFIGQAIGEGGLSGVKTYNELRQQGVDNSQKQRQIDLQAQELAQRAKQASADLAFRREDLATVTPLRAAQAASAQQDVSLRNAGIGALQGDNVLKPYLNTPYEGAARGAIASGNAELLAKINQEMAQYGLLPMGAGLPNAAATGTNGTTVPLDDYLKSIPDPLVRGQTGAVLRGETSLNALTSRSPGIAQQVNRLVYNYDDTFDPQAALRRNDYRMQLQKGPIQVQRQAIGTMFDHLNTAAEKAQAVNGTMPAWDAVKNQWNYQTGDDAANNLAIALNNYATEYAKLISGKAPAEGEIEQTRSMLHNAMSGKQLSGGLATLQELAMGRVHELQSQGDVVLGKYKTANDDVLSPNAQKAIERANKNPWLHPENNVAKPTSKAEYDALPSGTAYLAQDGVTVKQKP